MADSMLNRLIFDPAYIIIGLGVLTIILFITVIVCLARMKKLYRLYDGFMRGKDAETLEDTILKQFEDIKKLKSQNKASKEKMEEIVHILNDSYQKVGIVRYDAFKGMGGKLSFSLALLNRNNTGFIMNSVHSREGCYTYIKEVMVGETTIVLCNEEKEALSIALTNKS